MTELDRLRAELAKFEAESRRLEWQDGYPTREEQDYRSHVHGMCMALARQISNMEREKNND